MVNGGIDGYSRLITFMRVIDNNRADSSLIFFKLAVETYGLPSRVRTDWWGGGSMLGSENIWKREWVRTEEVQWLAVLSITPE